MKNQPFITLLGILCAVIGVSCSNTAPPGKGANSSPAGGDNAFAAQMFEQVNAYRRSRGGKDLQRHAGLDSLARHHCEYLLEKRGTFSIYGKNVSHMGFDGRAAVARERYQMLNISENVAAASNPGSNPVPALLALLKSSPDHHKNMVDDWTHTGVGLIVAPDGMAVATQLFATVSLSQMETRLRFNRF